jgi:hypothetical protein
MRDFFGCFCMLTFVINKLIFKLKCNSLKVFSNQDWNTAQLRNKRKHTFLSIKNGSKVCTIAMAI